MTCEDLREEYEAFALGIAEEPERSGIAEHLARKCPNCTRGVRGAAAVVASIASTAKPANPPKTLRRRVLAMVNPSGARSWIAALAPWAIAAALAVILVSIVVPQRRDSASAERLEEALSILNDPSARDVSFGEPAKPARGRVFVSPRRGIVLVAANMPAIPANRTFEMWVLPPSGNPIPAGTFRSDAEGAAVYVHPGPVANAAAVAVTVEPQGGSPQPTSTPFIVSRL